MTDDYKDLSKKLTDALRESQEEAMDEIDEINDSIDDIGGEDLGAKDLGDGGEFIEKAKVDLVAEVMREKRRKRLLRRAALVDPAIITAYTGGSYGPFRPRVSHVSYQTLKSMSLRDSIVASVIQTRVNQVAAFAQPQENRFDTGFKFIPRESNAEIGEKEKEEIKFLEDFIMNTGLTKYRELDDLMDFNTWLRVIIRDRLTYGAVAIETIRDREGRIHSFLPVPAETIYYANETLPDDIIDGFRKLNKQSFMTPGWPREKSAEADEIRERIKKGEYKYVQVIEGKIVQGFTRQDMVYKLGNPQNFIENAGYCIGELEMAITTVTSHLQAENYNRMFFTHGFAARGLLHIKGDITRAQLDAFRAQWYSQIAGNANSWRTPVIGGVDNVEWVPLSANNREMEYSVYIDHLVRTLCSVFQISPIEIGFGHVEKGPQSRTMSESSNEWKIQESKERGLRPMLRWLENIINQDIIPHVDPELAEKYCFTFAGLDAEDKEQELDRQTKELQVHSSINEIRKDIDKDPVFAGDLSLNPGYVEALLKLCTVGEIREYGLGFKGDASNPKYDFISDPAYLQYLQMGMEQQQMEEQAMVGGVPPEEGGEVPFEEQEKSEGDDPVESAVQEFLIENPELLKKSLQRLVESGLLDEKIEKDIKKEEQEEKDES